MYINNRIQFICGNGEDFFRFFNFGCPESQMNGLLYPLSAANAVLHYRGGCPLRGNFPCFLLI